MYNNKYDKELCFVDRPFCCDDFSRETS
jgi:hypothetical protein